MNRPRFALTAAGVFYSRSAIMTRKDELAARYFCLIAAFILLFNLTAAAQTNLKLHGTVFDGNDDHPIAGAAITLVEFGFNTVTDQGGRYRFENIPDGIYDLVAEAEGYYPDTLAGITITADLTCRRDIYLGRRLYHMPTTTSTGRAVSAETSGVETITRAQIDSSAARTVADILNQVEGIYVREDGAGRTEVSIRGSSSEHVLVLVDGQRYNASDDGVADLAAIPLAAVEKIEVYRGGRSARFGSAAIGGVINISTHITDPGQPSQLTAGQSIGKWKTAGSQLGITSTAIQDKAVVRANYVRKTSDNDFDYSYAVEPQPDMTRQYDGTRYNAGMRSENYFAAATVRFSPLLNLSLSAQDYDARIGLPGYASKPDSGAYKEDNRRNLSASFEYLWSTAGPARVNLGYARNRQYYNNVDNLTLPPPYENRTTSDRYSLQLAQQYQVTAFLQFEGGIDIGRDKIEQDNLLAPDFSIGKSSRRNRGIYAVTNLNLPAEQIQNDLHSSLELSLRYDHAATENYHIDSIFTVSQWSPHIGASVRYGGRVELTLRGAYGKSYRLPAINSLFWKGDARSEGNPSLKPELAEQSEAGLEIKTAGPVKFEGGITYFHNHVKNLIVWQAGAPGGVWKPLNLNRTLVTGHEEYITANIFDKLLELTYRNTITVARDIDSDRFLTYRPHYVTTFEARANYRILYLQYDFRMVAKRYNKPANTRWDPAYETADLVSGTRFDYGRLECDASYRVTNLSNENYILISHYPMPGRHWGIDMSLKYKF